MSGDPIRDDARRARRQRRLGSDAVCVLCGERTPDVLIKVRRSLLEHHHLAGEANDPELTVVVCRNDHAKLTEAQRVSGVELRRASERSSLARLEAVLCGLADFFVLLAQALRGWAAEIRATIKRLDEGWPGWWVGES
jgi:hypothetical protein